MNPNLELERLLRERYAEMVRQDTGRHIRLLSLIPPPRIPWWRRWYLAVRWWIYRRLR